MQSREGNIFSHRLLKYTSYSRSDPIHSFVSNLKINKSQWFSEFKVGDEQNRWTKKSASYPQATEALQESLKANKPLNYCLFFINNFHRLWGKGWTWLSASLQVLKSILRSCFCVSGYDSMGNPSDLEEGGKGQQHKGSLAWKPHSCALFL